ncbi:hypothetical protein [Henriciella pelagia]|uniref:hypothetical protein n=1 Tax=Henriciella pelagia TaxID=1977912 RepID=UPI0035176744
MNLGNHKLNLPWSIDPKIPGRVIDSEGVPVAFGSSTTSILESNPNDVTYRTTETVGPVRARVIVEAVNSFFKDQSS